MADINSVILTGRITKEPEIKKTPNGVSVMQFSLAVNDVPGKDGKQVTDFIQCVAWRNNAEFLSSYCHKGEPIVVSGKMKTRHYTHATTNQEMYITEVRVEDIVKQSWSNKNNAQTQTVQTATVQPQVQTYQQEVQSDPYAGFNTGAPVNINSDDLPF